MIWSFTKQIGSSGFEILCRGLAKCKNLLKLSVPNNEIGPAGMAFIGLLSAELPALSTLCLDANSIGDGGMEILAEHLPKLSGRLRVLSLRRNGLTAIGIRTLRQCGILPSLKSLHLDQNDFGDIAQSELALAHVDMPDLRILTIRYNFIKVGTAIRIFFFHTDR